MKHARETYQKAKAARSSIIAKKSADELKSIFLKMHLAEREVKMNLIYIKIYNQKTIGKLKELGYEVKLCRIGKPYYDISWDIEKKRPFTATAKGLLLSIFK